MIKIAFTFAMLSSLSMFTAAQVPKEIDQILKQITLPLQKTEKESEIVTNYYYQDQSKNKLVIGIASDFIDVSWTFKTLPDEKSEVVTQAKTLTQSLLGEEWNSLYSAITEGGTVDYLSQDNGIVITDAGCTKTMCGYQVKLRE
ncbi:hypothetical protein [Acinetobacter piscicola]|uniref:hypothetical protein n=1 Tax=Acinetobacter piscicola TaxID=2006115 RepID=UPI001020FC77|nr:hypothetical protein [Acinetobacter piscicola]RYL26570.1 hypothetical protein EWP19_08145 [Acinetobacter piscicola]